MWGFLRLPCGRLQGPEREQERKADIAKLSGVMSAPDPKME